MSEVTWKEGDPDYERRWTVVEVQVLYWVIMEGCDIT